MPRWLLGGRRAFAAGCFLRRRMATAQPAFHDIERISVPCGSSGDISVDLHNPSKTASVDPLLIYLPPCSSQLQEGPSKLPSLFKAFPTAVINYRWMQSDSPPSPASSEIDDDDEAFNPSPLHWPMPIHDTLRAYSWIVENLSPKTYTRRDIYVYGSYLGASLATSLALTETHPHQMMAIRGVVAFNGIYNWTTLLPDHPMHKPVLRKPRSLDVLSDMLYGFPHDLQEPPFRELMENAPDLFDRPDNLFDHFASPCLFFHTPGLLVPPSFTESAPTFIESTESPLSDPESHDASQPSTDFSEDDSRDFTPSREFDESWQTSSAPTSPDFSDSSSEEAQQQCEEQARKQTHMQVSRSYQKRQLRFPPRHSTLKIPETFLVHTASPAGQPFVSTRSKKPIRDLQPGRVDGFAAQAEDLAGLMRRSLVKFEVRDRLRWDDDFDGNGAPEQRVQLHNIGHMKDAAAPGFSTGALEHWPGNQAVADWLEDRMVRGKR